MICVIQYLDNKNISSIDSVSCLFCMINKCLELVAEIVLKMAQVIKDGSVRERKSDHDSIKKPQPMVIPARELVQVLAKVILIYCS